MIKVLDPYLQSLIAFGLIIGCLIGGWAIEKFGRKGTTMMCSVPFVLGWLLISYTKSVAILYAGRFITGVACGAVSFTVPVSIDDSSLHVVREKKDEVKSALWPTVPHYRSLSGFRSMKQTKV